MTSYWWFRPSRIALLVVMPLACVAFAAPNSFYQRFLAANAISPGRFFLLYLSLLGFAAGSWLGEMLVLKQRDNPPLRIPESPYNAWLYGLALIATAATLLFLAPFASRPGLVMDILKGDPGAAFTVSLYATQIPGITSQANLCSLVVVLLVLKPRLTGLPRSKADISLLVLIFLLMTTKVVVHSERLSLIELLVPACVITAGLRRRNAAWAAAPVIGILGMFLFFTGTEYLRSWVAFYANQSDSLLDFALTRMFGYYVTSINNGSYIYHQGHSYFFPIFTAEWIWHLPFSEVSDFLTRVTGESVSLADLIVLQNDEFNNTSGLFAPLIDFGPVLGITIWIALGYLSGRLYRGFVDGRYPGLILFPTWFIGLLELPRIFYWGDNRYFPPLVASLVVSAAFLHFRRQQTVRSSFADHTAA